MQEPIPEEPTKTAQSQPSDESSLTHNQSADKDDKTGDPVLVNGSSKANGDGGNNGVTAPSTEDILKVGIDNLKPFFSVFFPGIFHVMCHKLGTLTA